MDQKQRSGARMIVILMSFLMMFPFGACSTLDSQSQGDAALAAGAGGLINDRDIRQCLAAIRPHEDPGHYYRRGRYLQDRNKHRLAIQEFKSAIAAKADHVDAYNALGISLDITGNYTSAADAYEAALRIDPKRDDILNNLGYSCLLRKEFGRAVACFEQAVALNENNLRYWNNLGLAYAENGEYGPALAAFRQTAGPAEAHARLAGILRENGKSRAADQYLYLAAALEEDHLETKKLLERPIPAEVEPPPAIIEEDIQEENIQDDTAETSIAQPPSELAHYGSIGNETEKYDYEDPDPVQEPAVAEKPKKKVRPILDPVVASLSAFGAYTSSTPSSADAEDNPKTAQTESLEQEKTPEPAVSEPASPQPPGDLPDNSVIAALDTEATPVAFLEMQTAAPAENAESEDDVSESAPDEPAPATEPAESVSANAAATMAQAETDAGNTGADTVAVDIVSMEGLEAIVESLESGLDRSIFRIGGVQTVSDAEMQFPIETLVYYCEGYLQEAWEVAKTIPGWQNMEKVSNLTPTDIKIRAVLSRDLMPR